MVTTLYELSQRECEDLLHAGTTARVAYVTPDGPHIIPINYAVIDGSIILRTSPSSLLGIHGRHARLAIEIDGFDIAREQGWSVVARGVSEVVEDPRLTAALEAAWTPRPWVAGHRSLFLKVPVDELSGRRSGTGWSVVGAWVVSEPWFGSATRRELGETRDPQLRAPRRPLE